MIISYKDNYVFLHSRKTAGSSIAVSLAKHLGPKDIMIGCWPDAFENGVGYNKFALSIARKAPLGLLSRSIKFSLQSKKLAFHPGFVNKCLADYFRKEYGFKADAHSSAEAVKEFDESHWQSAFKFCFVRNPWTHAVSDYYWRTSPSGKEISFKEFLYRLADPDRPDPEKVRPPIITNYSVYSIDNKIAADFVGRYEKLDEDLKIISDKLGFEVSIQGIHAKGSVRPRTKSMAEHYDEETLELVRDIYKKEVEEFKYEVPF